MKKIGLVIAMLEEAKDLLSALGEVQKVHLSADCEVWEYSVDGKAVFAVSSGIGEIAAALATQYLIVKFGVEIIVNFGLVGSLSSGLKCGDLTRVREIVHYDFSLGTKNLQNAGKYPHQREDAVLKMDAVSIVGMQNLDDLPQVRIASGDKFIESDDMKNWLIGQFSAEICDMESAGIYFACKRHQTPAMMLKCVSDNADEHAHVSFYQVLERGLQDYIHIVLELLAKI